VLTPPRSLSQPATSFIASDCQGIHQMPLKTLEFKSRAGINPLHIPAFAQEYFDDNLKDSQF
jgi:hypothetical protein